MSEKNVVNLTELGLTEKESRVYSALLHNGIGTAEQIATVSGLNRSTTYVQIERLMEAGLVSKFKDGKKTKFAAESPHSLRRYLKAQETEIHQREARATAIIPDLLKIYAANGEQAQVRYFEGVEGLRQVREELLHVKTKEYYAAASIDNMNKLFTEKELIEFSKKRAKRNIAVKLLYTSSAKEELTSYGNQEFMRVDKDKFPFEADVYVYDDHVSFASTSERVGGVIIKSTPIAKTMRSMFQLAWHK